MKTSTLALFALLAACTGPAADSPEARAEKVKAGVREWVEQNAHDPASYQFVSLAGPDTVSETLLHRERAAYAAGAVTKGNYDAPSLRLKSDREAQVADSLRGTPAGNRPALYRYTVKCRMKNAAGGLVLTQLTAETDTTGTVTAVRQTE